MQKVTCFGCGKYKSETEPLKGDCSGKILRGGFGEEVGIEVILKGKYACRLVRYGAESYRTHKDLGEM